MYKTSLLMLLYFLSHTAYTQCNLIWPGIFVANTILMSYIHIIAALLIEAGMFYVTIKDLTPLKAFLVSLVGNAASTILGTIVMGIGMIGWHFIFDWVGGTFHPINIVATYIVMFIGTCLIELFTLKKVFKYSTKQLLLPVIAGNVITYVLAAITLIRN